MPTVNALVLAAGLGTRLRPITEHVPKCLAPVAGRPMLDWWVDLLVDAGVRDALINVHTLPELVRRHVALINTSGQIRMREVFEPKLLGSAGTIAANRGLADGADQVIIIYADNLSDVSLRGMLDFHRSHPDPFTMLLFRAANPSACGIAELDGDNRIVSFVEKPKEPKSDLANAGIYIVDADAYREIADMHAFDVGFEVLPKFVGRMRGWPLQGYHLDIGTLAAFDKAQHDAPALLARRKRFASKARPAVFFDRDGTLIEQVHYLSDPEQVQLLPGAAESIKRLRAAGFACVVVSNQSGVGRGMYTTDAVDACNAAMVRQLQAAGTDVDGMYYCTSVPGSGDRTAVDDFRRKPGPGMLWQAANELGLDLSRSYMVGDMISDILAGKNAQCRGSLLVETGKGVSAEEAAACGPFHRVPSLHAAADMILQESA